MRFAPIFLITGLLLAQPVLAQDQSQSRQAPGGQEGYGWGPGMMGPGWGPGYMHQWGPGPMMGPGMMMGPGWGGGMMMGPGWHHHQGMMGWGPGNWPQAGDVDVASVRQMLERHLAFVGNDRLRVGDVKQDGERIVAEIETVDGSLVNRFEVDPQTGMMRRAP